MEQATSKNLASASDKNKRIFDFLSSHYTGVLSTVDLDKEPYVSVLYYSVDEQFNITFTTKQGTKKAANLRNNCNAMFLVYDEKTQTTVQARVKAEDLSGSPEQTEIFRHTIEASMSTSDGGIPPISKLAAGDYTAFRLRPVHISMAVFGRPDAGDYDETFESVDL
ncbi:MAG: Pyridoxamine 5-phosphate oxidase family protein [Patescibacteria group bacterium]|jgi:nitroimidazol reductase NimA-like FMN-containing flavoprotein (pyridoxamine 5'-phosphate oxidase superfamily)|nr:Pyridoxamine 5-phosphate oxidase family protein [Patescibacteria group bacterium]